MGVLLGVLVLFIVLLSPSTPCLNPNLSKNFTSNSVETGSKTVTRFELICKR